MRRGGRGGGKREGQIETWFFLSTTPEGDLLVVDAFQDLLDLGQDGMAPGPNCRDSVRSAFDAVINSGIGKRPLPPNYPKNRQGE